MEEETSLKTQLTDLLTRSGTARAAVELVIALATKRANNRRDADWLNYTITDISKGRGFTEALLSFAGELEEMRKRADILA